MVDKICDISFLVKNFHEVNVTQLCIWIAFLRYAVQIEIVNDERSFRSMFIKKADTIIAVGGSKVVRFISLLVFFAWGTFTLLNVVVLATDPSIPKDLPTVRQCKGIFGIT